MFDQPRRKPLVAAVDLALLVQLLKSSSSGLGDD
jgi:hypothetical protein